MSQSLTHILIHLVYSTKHRTRFLNTPEIRTEMDSYLAGALRAIESPSIEIQSVEDHVHLLFRQSKNLSIAKIVEEIKKSSSQWVKTKGSDYETFYWQSGYAAFSVSQSNVEAVRRYIRNQEEHHKRVSFQDELREFFRRHGVEFDERYVWE